MDCDDNICKSEYAASHFMSFETCDRGMLGFISCKCSGLSRKIGSDDMPKRAMLSSVIDSVLQLSFSLLIAARRLSMAFFIVSSSAGLVVQLCRREELLLACCWLLSERLLQQLAEDKDEFDPSW